MCGEAGLMATLLTSSYWRVLFIGGYTSASCSKLEEQAPPVEESAEGDATGELPGEEEREAEAPLAPSELPLVELSQQGTSRLPAVSKARTTRVSSPSNRQQTL